MLPTTQHLTALYLPGYLYYVSCSKFLLPKELGFFFHSTEVIVIKETVDVNGTTVTMMEDIILFKNLTSESQSQVPSHMSS